MDPRNLIASRIDLQLRRHLGTAVDTHRALTDAHYMRDVLFVCDAMQGTALPLLARQFRLADKLVAQQSQRQPGRDPGPAQAWAADTSGFGVSQPPLPSDAGRVGPVAWFSASRWFRN